MYCYIFQSIRREWRPVVPLNWDQELFLKIGQHAKLILNCISGEVDFEKTWQERNELMLLMQQAGHIVYTEISNLKIQYNIIQNF